jgi:hypothetical protein
MKRTTLQLSRIRGINTHIHNPPLSLFQNEVKTGDYTLCHTDIMGNGGIAPPFLTSA